MAVWCLAFHAAWLCRHSGACCRAGWSIPVEIPAFETLRRHFGSREDAGQLFVHEGHMPEGAAAIVGTRHNGACVFFDEVANERRCEIHRTLGASNLPLACRQFPRVAMQDRRGTFVTLSHFCPTAAGLLLGATSFDVVQAPPGLALDGALEGLDATAVLPPLLRPNLLTDLDGYGAWERRALGSLADDRLSAEQATAAIEHATKRLDEWVPGNVSLANAVERAFREADPSGVGPDIAREKALFAIVSGSVPSGLEHPSVPTIHPATWAESLALLQIHDRPVRAWLAARLFGNWMAYSAPGLRVVATAVRAYLSVLRIEAARLGQDRHDLTQAQHFTEAVRKADLLIVHLSDVRVLTPLLARVA